MGRLPLVGGMIQKGPAMWYGVNRRMGRPSYWQRLEAAKKPEPAPVMPARRRQAPVADIDWSNDPVPPPPPEPRKRAVRVNSTPLGQDADKALRRAMRLADDVRNRR